MSARNPDFIDGRAQASFTRSSVAARYLPALIGSGIRAAGSGAAAGGSICLAKDGALTGEFDRLFASLFDDDEKYTEVVRALARKRRGLSRNELLDAVELPSGGGATTIRENLEEGGFISSAIPFGSRSGAPPVSVVPGNLYVLEVTHTTGSWRFHEYDAYPQGSMVTWCINNQPIVSEDIGYHEDFIFTTYALVGAPTFERNYSLHHDVLVDIIRFLRASAGPVAFH